MKTCFGIKHPTINAEVTNEAKVYNEKESEFSHKNHQREKIKTEEIILREPNERTGDHSIKNHNNISNINNSNKKPNLIDININSKIQNKFNSFIYTNNNLFENDQIINDVNNNNIYNKSKFDCLICFSSRYYSESKIEALDKNTNVCRDCLRSLALESIKDLTLMPPRVNKIELPEKTLNIILTKEEKNTFDEKKEEFYCQNKHYCQNKRCSKFINLDYIPEEENFICFNCGNSNCLICRTLSHPGIDCFENLESLKFDEDDIEQVLLVQGYKRCPKCRIFIELKYGCNHMKCSNCSFNFCFECLTEWKGNICVKGCKLFNNAMENILLNAEIGNLQRNNVNVNNYVRENILENIRNRLECLHHNRRYWNLKSYKYIKECQNCGYDLEYYGYKCLECNDYLVCKTCHLYRL